MKPGEKKTEMLEVRVSHEIKQKLQDKAAREGRSMSEVLRRLISKYLADSYVEEGRRSGFGLPKFLSRYPARVTAALTGLLAALVLPLSMATAKPVKLNVKGEIGKSEADVRNVSAFETTVLLEPGEMIEILPVPGREMDYTVSVRLDELEEGRHRIYFKVVETSDPVSGEVFEPNLITEAGRPARVHIDRGIGLYLSMEAAVAD